MINKEGPECLIVRTKFDGEKLACRRVTVMLAAVIATGAVWQWKSGMPVERSAPHEVLGLWMDGLGFRWVRSVPERPANFRMLEKERLGLMLNERAGSAVKAEGARSVARVR